MRYSVEIVPLASLIRVKAGPGRMQIVAMVARIQPKN